MTTFRIPKAGEEWREAGYGHQSLCVIIGTAIHTETLEPMIIYRRYWDQNEWYVRPLGVFLAMIDNPRRSMTDDVPLVPRFQYERGPDDDRLEPSTT